MPALLLYLLKINVALLLFYLAYHLVLRRLTFYHLNRKFLLFGILFSTVYPFIDITPFLEKHQELPVVYFATVPTWAPPAEVAALTPAFDYWQLPVWLFWLGAGVMALRLVLQFVSLYKIHAASVPDTHNGISFRKVWSITQAFSFWQNIYLNPSQHKQEELEPILRHELVHVREWHTLDVLLAEVSAVFYWFNPGAWLMKKGIKENLEFIADQDVVRAGADKKEYQYLLLKATGATEPQLALPFSFPSLKRRIAMLNKMPTRKANRLRLLVVLPIVAVLLLAFRGATEIIEIPEKVETSIISSSDPESGKLLIDESQDTSNLQKNYNEFLQRNPEVEKLSWMVGETGVLKVYVHLKSSGRETYDMNDSNSKAAAERKYGKFPSVSRPTFQNDDAVYIPVATDQHKFYQDFLNQNPHVKRVGWKGRKKNVLVIFLNSGATEMYNLLDEKSRTTAEQKYGKLPVLPPPPPPAVPDMKALLPPPPAPPVAPPAPPAPDKKGNASRFPGGEKAMFEYLLRNMRYPRAAINADVQGNSLVEFTVEKDGSLTNIKILNTPHESIGAEIIRVVSNMPKWNPAADDDPQPVFNYKLPVKLSNTADSGRERKMPGALPAPVPAPAGKAEAGKNSTDNTILQIINPFRNYTDNEIDNKKNMFMEHGFNLTFDDTYSQGEIATLKVSLAATKFNSRVSATFNMSEIREKRYAIVISANKETGELKIFSHPIARNNPTDSPVILDVIGSDVEKVTATVVQKSNSRSRSTENIISQLLATIKYPEDVKNDNIKGESKLVFTLEKDGSISNLEILSTPHEAIKKELIRAVNAMPKFLPAGANDSQQVETFKLVIIHDLSFIKGQVVKPSMGIYREL